MFSAIRTPRVYEHIAAQIERAIYEGRLQTGDKLPPERQLVREFGTSRVAVREALRTLEHRGLLEVRQGATGGYFIRAVDSGLLLRDLHTLLRLGRVSVAHLLEARLLVEPDVARLAAMRASESDLKLLRQAMDERAEAGSSGTPWRLLDLGFHRLVAEAAKNPVHTLLTHALMDLEADLTVPRIELTDTDSREIDGAHRDIYEAVVSRDAGRARATMEAHVVDVQRRLHRAEMQDTARVAASVTALRGAG